MLVVVVGIAGCALSPQSRRWLPSTHRSPGLVMGSSGGSGTESGSVSPAFTLPGPSRIRRCRSRQQRMQRAWTGQAAVQQAARSGLFAGGDCACNHFSWSQSGRTKTCSGNRVITRTVAVYESGIDGARATVGVAVRAITSSRRPEVQRVIRLHRPSIQARKLTRRRAEPFAPVVRFRKRDCPA